MTLSPIISTFVGPTLRSLSGLFLTLLVASGCGLIYKQNIQQGNALEQEELDELYIGMNERQVLFVLGTPSIKDPFRPDRWDYVQTFSRRGGEPVQRTVTLRFEDGALAEIVGQQDPFTTTTSGAAGTPGEMASFVKKPEQTPQENPQDASIEEAREEVLGTDPDIGTVPEPSAEDRDYKREADPLDQTPKDGPMGPDIDG
ncbi:MAG: outer membrane protein assembly factor BamE [Lysobacterales bacterium]|nr:MAG: outer membrane protein assembly factor BamE [Xanthomonadales bacterium]